MANGDRYTHHLDHNDKTQRAMNYLVAYLLLADLICVSAVTIGPRDTVLLTLTKGLFFTWLEEEKQKQDSAANSVGPANPSDQIAASIASLAPVATSRRWRGRCGGKPGRRPSNSPRP